MTISEMHVWFRQYAQQMGMQNVRAILPEQIDLLINTSITDTINQIIRENIGITNDRVITDNSKIGQINALRFLYKVKHINYQDTCYRFSIANGSMQDLDSATNAIITIYIANKDDIVVSSSIDFTDLSTFINNIIHQLKDKELDVKKFNISRSGQSTINFELIVHDKDDKPCTSANFELSNNGEYVSDILFEGGNVSKVYYNNFTFENNNYYNGLIKYNESLTDYLFLVDFSIDYKDASKGIGQTIDGIDNKIVYNNNFTTNLFPIRLIDDAYLADTLNDFVLKPRLRSPIMVICNNQANIYLGKLQGNINSGYFLDNKLVPNVIRMSYIAKPAQVKYHEDINGQNVDCDLPDYMHVDILKHAVDLYRTSIAGGISAAQAQDQVQNQEAVRNNYRNEGYQ